DENIRSKDQSVFVSARPRGAARIGSVDKGSCRAAAQGSRQRQIKILAVNKAHNHVRGIRVIDNRVNSIDANEKIIQYTLVHFGAVDAPGIGNAKTNPMIKFVNSVLT